MTWHNPMKSWLSDSGTGFAPWLVWQPHGSEMAVGSPKIPDRLYVCYTAHMEQELTKEEIDRRAREIARRVMSTPPQPQQWPGKSKAKATPERVSKPRKRVRAA